MQSIIFFKFTSFVLNIHEVQTSIVEMYFYLFKIQKGMKFYMILLPQTVISYLFWSL